MTKKIRFLKPFMGYKEGMETTTEDLRNTVSTFSEDIQTMIDCGIVEEVGKWKPEKNEEYYNISSEGCVVSGNWFNFEWQKDLRNYTGVFKTESEAQSMLDHIKKCIREREE